MRIFIYAEVQNEAIDLIELVNKIEATINDKIVSKPNNYYGTEFESLYIIPTCVGDDYWEALGWSERKIISRKKREAEIRLRINFMEYISSSVNHKYELLLDNIIKSIESISEKSRGDFKKALLINDIVECFESGIPL